MSVADWVGAIRGPEAFDLRGKRALVVGAARGSGRASALALAEAGAEVAIATGTPEEAAALGETGREMRGHGRRVLEQALDVSSADAVEAVVAEVNRELGPIDVLVNAPDLFLGKPATTTEDAEWGRVVARNLSATFFACRAVGRGMLRRAGSGSAGGRIVNVASILGERGVANAAAYCAAQGGILNLTRALAQEWAPHGITVNAIARGWLHDFPGLGEPDERTRRTVRFIPMKRVGEPDEIAPLVLYLVSDASGYVTGQTLFVDGGVSVHL